MLIPNFVGSLIGHVRAHIPPGQHDSKAPDELYAVIFRKHADDTSFPRSHSRCTSLAGSHGLTTYGTQFRNTFGDRKGKLMMQATAGSLVEGEASCAS
ncbi:hypothetical protein BDZ89DRAFT_1138111 [Hymenopellis radicata]|nr:hypothetical protein BDZ89DRAFT_1138111 [Hymenopellis radicata]